MSDKQIRVRATQPGYYGGQRAEGDEFYIDAPSKEGDKTIDPFSKNWMEKVVASDKPEKPAK